jgi:phospholipid/cholesterol/gamma-HCH transport system permease protein
MLLTIEVPSVGQIELDISGLQVIDTAGAWLIHRYRAELEYRGSKVSMAGIARQHHILIEKIEDHHPPPAPTFRRINGFIRFLENTGRTTFNILEDARSVFGILGAFWTGVARYVVRPAKIRGNSVIENFDRAGLEATSIIALMSFLIGGIIAQQGTFYLRQFGADLFVVNLVGVLALRELGVLLTAIMVAGRSGSAFTAEIGAMKMREEIDALRVMGMSPVEVLVVPRILALMIAMPILTFLADIAALFGSALLVWAYADIPPQVFIIRLQEAISIQTLMIGLIKAPFMALIIGLIACVEGFKVSGSAESLGRHTTLSVVKAIFMVIVVDGIFAIFFAAIGI